MRLVEKCERLFLSVPFGRLSTVIFNAALGWIILLIEELILVIRVTGRC